MTNRLSKRVYGMDDKIVTLFTKHALPTPIIAERFGISVNAVRAALARKGVETKPRKTTA